MTNSDIIKAECMLRGIDEPVNTFVLWKEQGRIPKKGSKALFSTMIWRPVKGKEEKEPKLIMVKAWFFGLSQTECLKEDSSSQKQKVVSSFCV